jgi:hypothetical protein
MTLQQGHTDAAHVLTSNTKQKIYVTDVKIYTTGDITYFNTILYYF